MYTGTMIEDLMSLTTTHLSANCDEVLRADATGQDVLTCRAETFEQCSNDDCQMPVCQKHEVVCKNCRNRFCKPCFLGHVC